MSKKNTIRRQATALFARQGFRETSTAEICRLSGVAGATLFYHFSSKEELLLAILKGIKEAILQNFQRDTLARQGKTGLEQIQEIITHYLRLAAEMEDEFLLLQRHFPYQLAEHNPVCRRHLAEIYTCLVDIFEDAILHGQKDGSIGPLSAHKTALILFSAVDGLIRFNTYKLYDAGALYQELLTCCSRILQPNPEPPPAHDP
ncbi:MAG: TetR/AcrR family transcriptional regulator [Desulfobacterales bacterium]